jgi:hypothetical protein
MYTIRTALLVAGISVSLSVSLSVPLAAQTDSVFTPPGRFEWLTGIPGTLAASGREAVKREHLTTALEVAGSTVLFYALDPELYSMGKRAGHALGVSQAHPVAALMWGNTKVIYVPTTISSGLYYLGDGWTTMFVAGAYYTVGKFQGDNRAVRTASEITQSLFVLGIVTQTLKHATGRQTPGAATTTARGLWRPFAPLKNYNASTPEYDAMPSGHLATAMATVTVIAENYPDNPWVKPVGYSLMGALSFAMVNNGVHWMSDYPLALAIGGTVGTVAARRGHKMVAAGASGAGATESRIEPLIAPNAIGLRVRW